MYSHRQTVYDGLWSETKQPGTHCRLNSTGVLRLAASTQGWCFNSVNSYLVSSIHLFHLGSLVSGTLNLLKRGQIIIVTKTLVIVVNAEAKLDHAVNPPSKLSGLIQVKARGKQRCVEQEPDEILDSLVRLVGCCLFPEFG